MTNSIVEYPDRPQDVILSPEEQHVLDVVNKRIANGNSLVEVMDFLFDMTHVVCAWDRLGLAFAEEDGQRLRAIWARAKYDAMSLNTGYSEDLLGSSLEPILREGKLRIIHDLQAYLEANPNSRSTRVLLREGVRSNLTCPLHVDGRPVGVFFRSSREPNAFGEREVAMHLAIAERLSQAVEKAYRIGQLEEANRSYIELLGFVSHELKSPLASLISSGKLLTEGYLGELQPRQQDRADRMLRQSEYLLGLIGEYLDLARLEGGHITKNVAMDMDLVNDVIIPAVEIVEELASAKEIRIEPQIGTIPEVLQGDAGMLKIVIVNLLSNAIKYGNDGGRVRLSCEQLTDGTIELRVWNTGPGFSEADKKQLFRKFSRLPSPELMKRKGTGVGLYNCWKVMQLHKGKILADSEEGKWAQFTVLLPQPIPGENA